jgi:hypothetical protein
MPKRVPTRHAGRAQRRHFCARSFQRSPLFRNPNSPMCCPIPVLSCTPFTRFPVRFGDKPPPTGSGRTAAPRARLNIIDLGTCVFNPPVLDPRRTYVPNICFNYIDNAYARDDRGPSHHLCCQRLEIWGFVSAVPIGNLQFDYIYRRSVLEIIDSRTHVLVPPRKSQLGEHISSLAPENYRFETTCPRLPLNSWV